MPDPDVNDLAPFVLGDPGPLRDRLVAAVLSGEKTATTSLLEEYVDEPLPAAGKRFRVLDSAGGTAAVVEVTRVSVISLADAPIELALAEGEGFTSIADWRQAHVDFWAADDEVARLGIVIADATQIVVEHFRLAS